MSTSSLFFGLPHSVSLLFLFLQSLGAGAQELELLQTQGPLRLTAGETLSLNCTVTGSGPPGGVRWYKGSDRSQPPIYTDQAAVSPRVTRIVPGSNTDWTILISNIQPKDAGIYYCVKFMAGAPEREFKQGKGTEVSVIATPSHPSISGPASRVHSGTAVTFKCTSEGFFPRDITLTWLKDGRSLSGAETVIQPPGESTSYNVMSTVQVVLRETDVKSELSCQIQHSTLHEPLRQSYKLGNILQVAPKVSVEPGLQVDAPVNCLVTINCHAKGFYPNDTILVWILDRRENRLFWRENSLFWRDIDLGLAETMTQEPDGRFSVKNSLEVSATGQRNNSVFTCYVVRNSQPSDRINVTLRVLQDGKGDCYSAAAGQGLLSQSGFWIGYVLSKAAAAVFLFFFFLRKMPKNTAREHTPTRVQETGLRESPVQ